MMPNAAPANTSSKQAPRGISLAHYAAIRAALAEGFPEADVFKAEGVTTSVYQKADLAFKQTLAKDNDALDSFIKMLADAEDVLARSVQPLADDALAWVSFLLLIEKAADPNIILSQTGLGLNDLSRLSRRWKKRVEASPTLAKDLGELRKNAGQKALPQIIAGPKVLKPSKFAIEPVNTTTPEQNDEASRQRWLEGHRAMLRSLVEKQAEEPPPPAMPAAPPPAMPIGPSIAQLFPKELAGTSLSLDIPRGPALPFAHGSAELPPLEEKPARTQESLSGTSLSLDIPRGPSLPFGQKPDAIDKLPPPLAGTALTLDIPRGPALPFRDGPAQEIQPKIVLPAAPAGLGTTSPVLHLPKGDILPFSKGAEAEEMAKTVVVFKLPKDLQKPKTPPPDKEPAPELALYTYAALCAQLAQGKANPDEIFKSFGLHDPETRALVDTTWKKKLQSDPALYAEWLRLFQYYSGR